MPSAGASGNDGGRRDRPDMAGHAAGEVAQRGVQPVYGANHLAGLPQQGFAFHSARRRGRKVTSVDEASALKTFQLWRNVATGVHTGYPDVEIELMYVDNAAMQLAKAPNKLVVVVASDLFGDILSDEATMLTGSIGMLPGISLDQAEAGTR